MRAAGPLLLALLLPAAGRADEGRPAAPLKALEGAVRKAVARARPSVVRVLVSRSDSYRKAPYWGVPSAKAPGRLGPFDAKAAAAKVPEDVPDRARALRAIRDYDLSDPDVVTSHPRLRQRCAADACRRSCFRAARTHKA